MVQNLKFLDVTLRDGGHCCNFRFSQNELSVILKQLNSASIDIIEIGYRNGYIGARPTIGKSGLCNKDYVSYCRKLLSHAELSVMVHPSLVNEGDINELKHCGVDLIRICVGYMQHENSYKLIKLCQQYQIKVSVNLTHASQYNFIDLFKVIGAVLSLDINMLYLADSNGSFLPTEIQKIYQQLSSLYTLPLGFHGHNNIGLAQANTLYAIDSGALLIDASLNGIGKGGGNLVLEDIIAYLYACNHHKYDLNEIIIAAKVVFKKISHSQNSPSLDEYIRGINDLSTKQLDIKKRNHLKNKRVLKL